MNDDDHPIMRNKNMVRREIINHFARLAYEAICYQKGDARATRSIATPPGWAASPVQVTTSICQLLRTINSWMEPGTVIMVMSLM